MKALAIIVNIFIPGIGTIIIGKPGQGITQFVLWSLGVLISFSVVGAIIGVPLSIAAWIWAIAVSASAEQKPVRVEVIQRDSGSIR